ASDAPAVALAPVPVPEIAVQPQTQTVSVAAPVVSQPIANTVSRPVDPNPAPQTGGGVAPLPITSPRIIDPDVTQAIAQNGTAKVIIVLRPSEGVRDLSGAQDSLLDAIGTNGLQNAESFTSIPAISGTLTAEGLAALRANGQIARVYIDQPTEAFAIRSAEFIGADDVQNGVGTLNNTAYTGDGVQVAIVDTGVNTSNPGIGASVVAQKCFVAPFSPGAPGGCPGGLAESDSAADSGEPGRQHGTNVAAIITAPDGVAPDAQIVAVRVLDNFGRGTSSDWMHGLEWILQQNTDDLLDVKVINLSLGSNELYSSVESCIEDAVAENLVVQQLLANGVIIVAATGNQGSTTGISAPACLPGVISVGAVYDEVTPVQPAQGTYFTNIGGLWPNCADTPSSADRITCFSNANSLTDVLAPGARILVSGTGGTGTSQAAPHIAGVAALMVEAAPTINPATAEGIFRFTGPKVTDTRSGLAFRRVNAVAAVNRAVSPDGFIGCTDGAITVSESVCNALVAIYQSTNGADWEINTNWLQSADLCTWYGVVCTGDAVTSLILEAGLPDLVDPFGLGNNLTGTLPPEIIDLVDLEILNLTYNPISGALPPLPDSLKQIVLVYADFSGNLPEFPPQLEDFYAGSNEFTGPLPTLPTTLLNIDLTFNQLTGPFPAALHDGIRVFNVPANQMAGEIPDLPDSLIGLNIGSNKLTGAMPATLPPNIVEFCVSNTPYNNANGLTGSIPNPLPASLQTACFDYNQLTGTVPNLPAGINYFTAPNNQFIGTVPTPPQGMFALGLSGNNLTGSIPALPSSLTYLDLSSNQLTGTLPPSLSDLTSAYALYFSDNDLTGTIPDLSNLVSIEYFDLSLNRLTGPIPDSIGDMTALLNLYWNDNLLSGPIPDSIGNLSNLTYLALSRNQLEGDIPDSITNLPIAPPTPSLNLFLGYNRLTAGSAAVQNYVTARDPFWENTQLFPPTNINVTPLTSSSARFSWTPSTFTSTAQYEIWASSGGPYSRVHATSPVTPYVVISVDVGGLNDNISYDFQVRLVFYENYANTLTSAFSSDSSVIIEVADCTNSGGVPLSQCLALEALYDSGNGQNWGDASHWLQSVDSDWLLFGASTNAGINAASTGVNQGIIPTTMDSLLPYDGVRFSDDGATVAIAGTVGGISQILINQALTPSENIETLNLGTPIVTWDYDGDYLVYYTNTVLVVSEAYNLEFVISLTDPNITDVDISPDGTRLATAYSDGRVVIYNIRTFDVVAQRDFGTGGISAVDYDGSGSRIVVSSLESFSAIWVDPEGADTVSLRPQLDSVVEGTFNEAGTKYISIEDGATNVVIVYNYDGFDIDAGIIYDDGLIYKKAGFSADGLLTYLLDNDGNLTVYDTDTNNVVWSGGGVAGGAVFNPAPITSGFLPCAWHGVRCQFGDVVDISLSTNNIQGSLPQQLGDLSGLKVLDLSQNLLEGTIPAELGDASALEIVNLSANFLSGAIPSELGNLTALAELNLGDNDFYGVIPLELGQMPLLGRLDLRNNRMTLENATTLFAPGNFLALDYLELDYNDIKGEIPSQISNVDLQELWLLGAQFEGDIPASFGGMTRLTHLLLNFNPAASNQAGPLPSFIGNLTNLQFLHINGMRVPGPIPASYSSLNALTDLNLNNNQLTGNVPAYLNTFPAIVSIELNQNNLKGFIPEELTTLDGQVYRFNVRNNLLEGSGFIPAFFDIVDADWDLYQNTTPQNVEFSEVTTNSVTLSWDAIAGNLSNGFYQVLCDTS
ncbi:MAG: S8 family serine peptidase, partial [Chitinophagaceae bacterium]|nr:S8 family serine peptidase [Anaerolineae bacterium]